MPRFSLWLAMAMLLAVPAVPPAAETLRLGVYHNPPFSFIDNENRPGGLAIDLLRVIARQRDWTLEYIPCEFSDCLQQLRQAKLDLLAPVARSETRARYLLFNKEPLFLNWGRLYVAGGHPLKDILDLEGKPIAVLAGDIHYQAFRKMCASFGVHTRFIEKKSYREVARAVASGEAAAGLLNRGYGEWQAGRHGLHGSPLIFNPIETLVAWPKASPRSAALAAAIDGELQQLKKRPHSAYYTLLQKWLDEEKPVTYPPWLWWVLIVGGSLVLLLLGLMLLLRMLVKKKTAKLEKEVAERKQAEQALKKFSRAVEQSPVSVVITDTDGIVEYVNRAFENVTGYSRESMLGRDIGIVRSGRTPQATYEEMWKQINSGNEWRGEFCNMKKNGSLYWESVVISPIKDETGRITHFIGIKEDITRRLEYEKQLLKQANYDEVTGLPNRILLLDRMAQALAGAHRLHEGLGVLFIDLDDFKKINDIFGHETGDRMLKMAAGRLQGVAGEEETVARLGGDEFFIVVPHILDLAQIEAFAERVLASFSAPFQIAGREVMATASIGIAQAPLDGSTPHELLKNAEAAMYLAKKAGKNVYRFFTLELNKQAERRLNLENRLRHALKRNELSLLFQPLVTTVDARPVGAEALLRWSDPVFGQVPPDEFIPLAEATDLISDLGHWVLETALDQARQWEFVTGEALRLAVNISPRQLARPDFCQGVEQMLSQFGFPAEKLELEITERILLADDNAILSQLQQLDRLGVRLSVDDFGTGYSALGYLKRFPIDTIKIDRSFVSDMVTDKENEILVRTIIAMGHGLGLEVIAEGVEEEGQMALLREKRCDLAQGYLFSRPLASPDFSQWLRKYWQPLGAVR